MRNINSQVKDKQPQQPALSCISISVSCVLIGCSLLLNPYLNAGVWGPTAHSRANCYGFNESVTWHAGHSY